MKTLTLVDPTLQRFQQNVSEAVNPIQASGIVNGRLVQFTAMATIAPMSDIVISHGLGQPVTAILPALNQIAGAFFSVSPSKNPSPNQLMILRCSIQLSAGQSASFWVW